MAENVEAVQGDKVPENPVPTPQPVPQSVQKPSVDAPAKPAEPAANPDTASKPVTNKPGIAITDQVQDAVSQALAQERTRVSALLVGAELRAIGIPAAQVQAMLSGMNIAAFTLQDGSVNTEALHAFIGSMQPAAPASGIPSAPSFGPAAVKSFHNSAPTSINAYIASRRKAQSA